MERKLISGYRRIAGLGNWPRRVIAPARAQNRRNDTSFSFNDPRKAIALNI